MSPMLSADVGKNRTLDLSLADDRLLDEHELSLVTGLSVSKIRKLRASGGGPAFVKIGAHRRAAVRYPLRDLREWLGSLARRS
jgi:predicted DNA-binding transcriptional regulator AlpA